MECRRGIFACKPKIVKPSAMAFILVLAYLLVASSSYATFITCPLCPPANKAPVANSQSLSVNEGETLAITLVATDEDGDSLTYTVGEGPANGTLSGSAPDLTYTPNAGFDGTDTFTFTASDGTATSNLATVTIVVCADENNAPVANSQLLSVNQGETLDITLEATDEDGDPLTYTVGEDPANGTLSGTAPDLTYTPNSGFSGTDKFTFTASDGKATSNIATITIAVCADDNNAPVAKSQSLSVNQGETLAITLVATDEDGDALTYDVGEDPANGTLSGTAPNLTYTPDADFAGTDKFTFTASDDLATSNIATVTITVKPCVTAQATIDFDNLTANYQVPVAPITVEGVTVSFDGLAVVAEGDPNGGFWGTTYNAASGDSNFSGNSLSATGRGNAAYRGNQYVRTITFSEGVSNVSFLIADIDAGQGITSYVYDTENNLLEENHLVLTGFESSGVGVNWSLHGQVTSFVAKYDNIGRIELRGNDPVGIDYLQFYTSCEDGNGGGNGGGNCDPKVTAGKNTYTTNQSITVTWENCSGGDTEWIAIAPASASDTTYKQWIYTGGKVRGSHTFTTALSVGAYEVRGYLKWSGTYKVVARSSFTVSHGAGGNVDPVISACEDVCLPHENIAVSWKNFSGSNTDWITVVPASAPDTTYKQWFYTGGAVNGSYSFSGLPAGTYEIRGFFNWSGGGGYKVVTRKRITISH